MRRIKKSLLSVTSVSLLSSAAMFGINTTSVLAAETTAMDSTKTTSESPTSKNDTTKSKENATEKVDTENSVESPGSTIEVVGNSVKKTEENTTKTSDTLTSKSTTASEAVTDTKLDEKTESKQEEIKAADYQIVKDSTENTQFEKIISEIIVDVEKKNKEEIHTMATEEALQNPTATDTTTAAASKTDSSKETTSSDTSDTKTTSLLSHQDVLDAAKQVKAKQAQKVKDEMIKLGEKGNEAEYLYGNYLVKSSGFKSSGSDTQDVTVKFRLLSMLEKQLYEITNSTELLDSYNKLVNTEASQEYQKTFTVGMVDVSAPQINLTDKSTELVVGDDFKISDYVESVVDDEDGEIEYTTNGTVDTSTKGEYNIVVTATDAAGNKNETGLTITVKTDLQKTFYDKIAEAAKAQIGVEQDCTMLVTNSLKAVGINFHGWPIEYKTLGEWTDSPVPGDIIIYEGHVALYIGNGRAIHGGWMGHTTREWSVECSNRLIGYVHVTPPASYQ